MAKTKGRAPFTMKGFSYPGESPLRDAKQQTMMEVGTAGGREYTEPSRPHGWRGGGSGSGGRSWTDILSGSMGALSMFGGGGGGVGAAGAIGKYFMGGIGSGLFGGLFGRRGRGRRPITTRGERGYDLGTPNPNQAYVSQHQTLMNS